MLLLNLSYEEREFALKLPSPEGFPGFADIFESGISGQISEGVIKIIAAPKSVYILKLK